MNSQKLEDWIKQSSPFVPEVSPDLIRHWAAQQGYMVRDYGRPGRWEVRSDDSRCFSFAKNSGIVFYPGILVEKGEVGYSPHLTDSGGSGGELADEFLGSINAIKVAVKLPEPVVTLPVPAWIDAVAYNGMEPGCVVTLTCFKSEVKELIAPFVAELRDFLAQCDEK